MYFLDKKACPACGSCNTAEDERKLSFWYGIDNPVKLEYTTRVLVCDDCKEFFTDEEGEEARARAVEEYQQRRGHGPCPDCHPDGVHGQDPLCDEHWREYLGTHYGGRGED